MKKVYIIAAIAALICGGIIFAVFRIQNNKVEEEKRAAEELSAQKAETITQIVTASRNIVKGETFTQDMLTTVEMDKAVLLSIDALTDTNAVIGRQAAKNISSGEAITSNALRSLTGSANGIVSMNIPKGMSAIQIDANVDNAVGEHIEEGDYIDILTANKPEQSKTAEGDTKNTTASETAAKDWSVLCEHVQVVKLGDRFYKEATSDGQPTNEYYRYVIVAVEQNTAIRILNAVSNGEIKMLLNSSREE